MSKAWALCVLILVGGCGASESPEAATRHDCERLRDHLIEVRLESVTADVAEHRAALAAALGPSYIDRCVADVAPAELRCLMKAGDGTALAACGH